MLQQHKCSGCHVRYKSVGEETLKKIDNNYTCTEFREKNALTIQVSDLIKITWELKPSLWKFLWVETLKMFPQGGLSETSKKNRKKQRSTNPTVISTWALMNTKIPSHGLENLFCNILWYFCQKSEKNIVVSIWAISPPISPIKSQGQIKEDESTFQGKKFLEPPSSDRS